MKKFSIIASFLFLILYAEKTYACSCIPADPEKTLEQQVGEAYENSSAVFSAKVLAISGSGYNKKVKLKLTKTWKGKLDKSITLTTAMDSAMCGYRFEAGKTYLIYARGDKNLTTNLCTRTAEAVSNKDIAILDKMKKKT